MATNAVSEKIVANTVNPGPSPEDVSTGASVVSRSSVVGDNTSSVVASVVSTLDVSLAVVGSAGVSVSGCWVVGSGVGSVISGTGPETA